MPKLYRYVFCDEKQFVTIKRTLTLINVFVIGGPTHLQYFCDDKMFKLRNAYTRKARETKTFILCCPFKLY